MKTSAKQQVYLEILEMVLPLFRNIEALANPGEGRGSYLLEADFIHNVPSRLLVPEFQEEDLHWLNFDARAYVLGVSDPERILYRPLCGKVSELFHLVPEEMKSRLDWHGPAR